MTILDSNGLIYCLREGKALPTENLVVTEDLRDEYETALLVNGHRKVKMMDIDALHGYDDSFYYKEYAKYLNCFPGVNVASMRSLTDVSILALVSCIVNHFGAVQQLSLSFGGEADEKITVITDDGDLIKCLESEYKKQVEVISPTSFQ